MGDLSKPVQLLTSIGRTLYHRRRTARSVTIASLVGLGIGGLALGYLLGRRRPAPRAWGRSPVTPATVPVNPADSPIGEPGRNDQARLDEALQESFPGSDPVSVRIE